MPLLSFLTEALTLPGWQLLLAAAVFFGLGALAGIAIMCLLQINHIDEPFGIVPVGTEEEVLP
ncbi:MAG: hypothetical protein A2Y38_15520 [Spirochaetes bacterium GWB1_59_5]|nr:MAG: hypothetical protein A2Y38_15520 [Spirochaetes bacterium GWB1_59_5]